ncbi:MAG: phosphodiesterase, partial [Pseudomonadota bacterium]
DNRDLLRRHLPMPANTMTDFVQSGTIIGRELILCLDTHRTGEDRGELCSQRRDWLIAILKEHADLPTYLFLHHPPMQLGLPMQDTDNMADGEDFLDLISTHHSVRYMFVGHVHRPISGVVRGIPFSTMRSVLYQAPAPYPLWDWSSFLPSKEAPQIGVLTLNAGDVTLQYEQFCGFATGME